VIRCWQAGGNDNLEQLRDTILGQGLTDVVVQFNFSFFNLEALTELVAALDQRGVRVYMFLHSTRDVKPPHEPRSLATMGRALSLCRRVFVHSINDLNNLKEKGIFHNTTLFPHGVKVLPAGPPCSASGETGQVLAAFGFLLPHKGTLELIQAFEIVRKTRTDVKLLLLTALYPGGASEDEYSRCRTRIDKSPFREDITLVTDYLEEQTVNDRLTRADLIVYPYQHTQESSSAAVRTGLATGRPVATTCLEIFDDVADVVYTLPGRSPAALAEGIAELLADPALKERLAANQQAWLDSHSWERLGPRLGNIMVANAAKYPGPDLGSPDLSANGRPV
jgi:glycosyltransferase involved in cell wall biosynthesis